VTKEEKIELLCYESKKEKGGNHRRTLTRKRKENKNKSGKKRSGQNPVKKKKITGRVDPKRETLEQALGNSEQESP